MKKGEIWKDRKVKDEEGNPYYYLILDVFHPENGEHFGEFSDTFVTIIDMREEIQNTYPADLLICTFTREEFIRFYIKVANSKQEFEVNIAN